MMRVDSSKKYVTNRKIMMAFGSEDGIQLYNSTQWIQMKWGSKILR